MKLVIYSLLAFALCLVTFPMLRIYKLKSEFDKIENGQHILEVGRTIGFPNVIEENYYDQTSQNWNYFSWPIPRVFTVTIRNNEVVSKYDSISP